MFSKGIYTSNKHLSRSMPRFQVTFKGDRFDITVSGDASEDIVQSYKTLSKEIDELIPRRSESKIARSARVSSHGPNRLRTNTLPGRIMELVVDGFFDQDRKLSEIQDALQKRGLVKPVNTISARLMELVRTGSLERDHEVKDSNKSWVYRKRQ